MLHKRNFSFWGPGKCIHRIPTLIHPAFKNNYLSSYSFRNLLSSKIISISEKRVGSYVLNSKELNNAASMHITVCAYVMHFVAEAGSQVPGMCVGSYQCVRLHLDHALPEPA